MIHYLPGDAPAPRDAETQVEFIDGPRAGRRETHRELPDIIAWLGGAYRRSASCADHGAVRYVWTLDAEPAR